MKRNASFHTTPTHSFIKDHGESRSLQTRNAKHQIKPPKNPGAKSEAVSVKPSFITIEAGNEQFMDRACIQIGSGNTLRKMTINDQVSHVYVMHDGKDYAAATIAEAQGGRTGTFFEPPLAQFLK